METSLLIAGFGGQGVMSMGQMLGYAASDAQKMVTFFPSYGAEQRGGTANCTVIISEEDIGSPMVARPDVLIAMNEPSYEKFKDAVKEEGIILANSSLIMGAKSDASAKYYGIPVNDIASQSGNAKAANLVMLGAYIAWSGVLDVVSVKAIIKKVLGKKEHLLESNLKAFDAGYDYVKREFSA